MSALRSVFIGPVLSGNFSTQEVLGFTREIVYALTTGIESVE